jgi:hypothetical protein
MKPLLLAFALFFPSDDDWKIEEWLIQQYDRYAAECYADSVVVRERTDSRGNVVERVSKHRDRH